MQNSVIFVSCEGRTALFSRPTTHLYVSFFFIHSKPYYILSVNSCSFAYKNYEGYLPTFKACLYGIFSLGTSLKVSRESPFYPAYFSDFIFFLVSKIMKAFIYFETYKNVICNAIYKWVICWYLQLLLRWQCCDFVRWPLLCCALFFLCYWNRHQSIQVEHILD